jgi:hypothetical protein
LGPESRGCGESGDDQQGFLHGLMMPKRPISALGL